MGLEIRNTDSKNMDFIELVKLLDRDLEERYGDLQKQYDKHNKADYINDVVIVYKDNVPVACGAFKKYDDFTAEIKRIFVTKENRHQGISKLILNKLEELVRSKGYKYAVLETGIKQFEAINLYKNALYEITAKYEPYAGNTNSVCMRKVL